MAAILRENEQMPWTELSGASFVFAFLNSRLCKQIGKNADVLFVCGYIMGLTLRCRRYIFLGSGLHLELLHGLLGLGNVKLVIVAAHLNSLLIVVFRERTPVFGENRLFLSAGIACVVSCNKFPAFSGNTGEEWKTEIFQPILPPDRYRHCAPAPRRFRKDEKKEGYLERISKSGYFFS